MFRLLARLSCCGKRARRAPDDADYPPNETTHLIQASDELCVLSIAVLSFPATATMAMDHQLLADRLGTIVRSKESKMVNLGARTPFTLRRAEAGAAAAFDHAPPLPPHVGLLLPDSCTRPPPSSPTTAAPPAHAPPEGPAVLTLTPARGARRLPVSRYTTPTGSRASSRRPAPEDGSALDAPAQRRGRRCPRRPPTAETETETEGESIFVDAPAPAPATPEVTATTASGLAADTLSIVFSWHDV
ncbi:hypothetical protein GGX14DRAFT_575452 [Mycena pura]|uniref:Uncharacterized protein n=1 Tax=Mycena pura TaxID=153505 RepID=A0AAD6Y460_9AGAR|nr:hypothetical protein GGX14DRAFT_575452 [Mycena pura]